MWAVRLLYQSGDVLSISGLAFHASLLYIRHKHTLPTYLIRFTNFVSFNSVIA